MRYKFILVLLLAVAGLTGAEIREGKLWLDVCVANDSQVIISCPAQYGLTFATGNLALICTGMTTFQIIPSGKPDQWGIVEKSLLVDRDTLDQVSLFNYDCLASFKDGVLNLQYAKPVFSSEKFTSREAAVDYAHQHGFPGKTVRLLPPADAKVRVTFENGSTDEHPLPLYISNPDSIYVNGSLYAYRGGFLLTERAGKLVLINTIDLETYVKGVVPNEIGNDAPLEALKAQAVAARTHAVSLLMMNRHKDDSFDLCSGTHCQVYKGGCLYNDQIRQAAQSTQNTIMTFEGTVADAVYHSNCGGKTEANQNAWSGDSLSYLQGISCYNDITDYDLTNETQAIKWITQIRLTNDMSSWERRSESWEKSITRSELERNTNTTGLKQLLVLKRGVSGRILKLKLIGSSDVTLEGEYKIRQAFGGLPSSLFFVSNGNNTGNNSYDLPGAIYLKGKGSGHGVGLCQVGTLQKARNGWKYIDILKFYYPGIALDDSWLTTPIPIMSQDGKTE